MKEKEENGEAMVALAALWRIGCLQDQRLLLSSLLAGLLASEQ
jgi:hypothetical protein